MTEALHIPNATPYDLIAEDAQQWIDEARNWADGSGVENQKQADAVSALIENLRKSGEAAEAQRKIEVKPHDEAKAAVQEKYAPLFADAKNKNPGAIHKHIAALKATLQPYLNKLDQEKREKAAEAQRVADAAAQAAREAAQAANAASMEDREAVEAQIQAAEDAQRAATAASKDKAHANGGTRAMGLRSVWTAKVVDDREAMRHFWTTNREAFADLLQKLATDQVRAGKRNGIPGVEITEDRVL